MVLPISSSIIYTSESYDNLIDDIYSYDISTELISSSIHSNSIFTQIVNHTRWFYHWRDCSLWIIVNNSLFGWTLYMAVDISCSLFLRWSHQYSTKLSNILFKFLRYVQRIFCIHLLDHKLQHRWMYWTKSQFNNIISYNSIFLTDYTQHGHMGDD